MIRHVLLVLAALLAAPATAQAPALPAPTNYRVDQNWLCLPGRVDLCTTPLGTTALNPNGYGSVGQSSVAKDPPLDCFYVYPTVSRDRGLSSDLIVDNQERFAVQSQFARFSQVCRTYAPIYRQMTVSAIAAYSAGADIAAAAATAYGDVAAAFRDYLKNRNAGRPFVLVGHSQGSLLLQQLIAREIEGKPVAKQMRLAIIPGFNVFVPQGKLVGGTFKSTPLCSRVGETGCVMTWVSFRENNPPPEGALFGLAPPGMTVGCVNPALPGSRSWQPLDSYWPTHSTASVPGGPISWSTEGPPPTPFVRTEGLVSGRCVNAGQRGYLEIRTNADPRDKRTDRVGGEVGILGMFIPGWGMHLSDMSEAMGDVLRAVEQAGTKSR